MIDKRARSSRNSRSRRQKASTLEFDRRREADDSIHGGDDRIREPSHLTREADGSIREYGHLIRAWGDLIRD